MAGFKKSEAQGTTQEPIKADVYEGRCYSIIELGTQEEEYQGEIKHVPKVMFFFELPELMMEFEKEGEKVTAPRVISAEYTNSTSKKAKLKGIVEAWTGLSIEDIEMNNLAGMPATITVKNTTSKQGKLYASVQAITKMKDKYAEALAPQHNPTLVFSIDEDGFDSPKFEQIYGWVKDKIKKSAEYQEYLNGPKKAEESEEDIPFV